MRPVDAMATAAAFILAYSLRAAFLDRDVDLFSHLVLLPVNTAFVLIFLTAFGAYDHPRHTSLRQYAGAISRAIAVTMFLLFTTLFLTKSQYVSRAILLTFAGLDALALTLIRAGTVVAFQRAAKRADHFRNALIVGSGSRARCLAEHLRRNPDWETHIVGHLDPDPARLDTAILQSKVIGTVGDISSILKVYVVDEVIIAMPRTMLADAEKIARACEEEGIKLRVMADLFDLTAPRVSLAHVGSIPLLTLEPVAQNEWQLLIKRLLDLLIALLTLPLVVPVLTVAAVAIKLDSPGPIFFFQERVGRNKRRFRMVKLRSMVKNADALQQAVEHLNEAEGPIFKVANDPRLTRVGRFLRLTSLDELPQMIHVITGQMSLVGPRPMSLRDVERFDQGTQRKRFSVTPGLTCLWQISGRSNLPFSRWLELDLEYITHWSLWLDLKILLKTIPAVLKRTGAA